MYQALYRKYRPKKLDDVTGQDIIIKTLENAIKNNKINHAYLFTGPRGTGKTSVAKILAKIMNCTNLIDYNACGNCVNCTQKENPDILEIDAASNNGVDEIREIKNKINLVPSFGKYKIYIIDEVHMLSIGAFNALLKTLEDPPQHVIFILATTEPHKIPMTILSRCQRFDFKKVSEKNIVDRLTTIIKEEKIDIEKEAITEVARLSDGGLRDAINILDQAIAYCESKITIKDIHDINGTINQDEMKDLLLLLFNCELAQILNKIDEYNNKGKNLVKLTEEIATFLKNILIYIKAPNYYENNETTLFYKELSEKIECNKLLEIINLFVDEINNIKYSNNPKLKMELLVIKVVSQLNENDIKIINISHEIENIENKDRKKEKKLETSSSTNLKDDYLTKIKEIRINNTLSEFDKKKTSLIKKEIDKIKENIYSKDNLELLTLLLDGKLKAASDRNIIFLYETINLADYFNKNIIEVEKIIEEHMNHYYKIIAVSKDEWEIIKNEFNNKTKKYIYVEEKIKIPVKTETNCIIDTFGDIIEYK